MVLWGWINSKLEGSSLSFWESIRLPLPLPDYVHCVTYFRLTRFVMTNHPKNGVLSELFEQARFKFCGFDPITGLVGKVFFDLELKSRLYEQARYEIPLCLGSVSIKGVDSLSQATVNIASLFHDVGQCILEDLRLADRATWFQPDAFAILLPHTSIEYARQTVDRLKSKIDLILKTENCESLACFADVIQTRDGSIEDGATPLTDVQLGTAAQ